MRGQPHDAPRPTGKVDGFNLDEYEIILTLGTPVVLTPGTYWIELHADTGFSGQSNDFVWSFANPDPTTGIPGIGFALEYPTVTWGSDGADMTLVICGRDPGGGGITKYCNPGDGHPNNTSGIDVSGNVLSQGPIDVCLTGGPPNQFGYLLIGNSNGIVNQPPGSEGDLCIAGGNCVGRYALDIGQIANDGSLCTDIQNSASGGANYGVPTCGGNITAGDTWYFQYWHRQAGQLSTFSEAASVTFVQ